MNFLHSWFDRRASQSTAPRQAKSPDPLPHSQSEEPATPHTVDGVVEMRDGRVSVTDPRGLGRFPTVVPGRDVVVFVDGKIIDRPTLVTSRSSVEVHTPPHPPTRRMSLRLSDSELEAQLIVERGKGKEFKVDDQPPAVHLTVTASVQRETEPPPLTVEEVLRFLEREGVTTGVDLSAVVSVLEGGGTVTVARGVPPVPGEAGHIESYFPESEFIERPPADDEPRVDLLDRKELVSVTRGTVLARKIPVKPGHPGVTVTDKVIPPPPVRDVALLAGPGVVLSEDGLTAVADLIKGDIGPGIKVKASGEITVLGNAEHSELIAGGNVRLRGNAIGCLVRAGGLDAVETSLIIRLEEVALELELLAQAVAQIKAHPSFRTADPELDGDGRLIRLLLDRRFSQIPVLCEAILRPENRPEDPQLLKFLEECTQCYSGLGPLSIRDAALITADVQELRRKAEVYRANINRPAKLEASYALNCRLEASGDVSIIGDGCYNTDIRAGGKVLARPCSFNRDGLLELSKLRTDEEDRRCLT